MIESDDAGYLEFVYTREFVDSAEGLLGDDAMRSLELDLLDRPDQGDVIAGTGGVRKLRVAAKGKGKSGGVRILYVYVSRPDRIYFLLAYPKNVRGSLGEGEKNALKKWIQQLQEAGMARVTDETFASRLLKSAEEATAIKAGVGKPAKVSRREKVTARELVIAEPPAYSGAQVIQIREEIGVSQPVFAQMLGVAAVTVKSWEQGKKPPAGTARRLLQVMEARPAIVKEIALTGARVGRNADVRGSIERSTKGRGAGEPKG